MMNTMNNNIEKIPQEKFAFVQLDARLSDKKLETKARGYFADAMLRFSKNKSSVVAAWILLFLLLYAIFAPIISPYSADDKDNVYISAPAYVRWVSDLGIGILDGARTHGSQNETSMNYWRGIGEETGYAPLIKIVGETTELVKVRGQMVERKSYTIETNRYYETGIVYRTMTVEAFNALQDWQNETGIQVIYPYVEVPAMEGVNTNVAANLWYQCDNKGSAILDKDGNFIPNYSTNKETEATPYYSQRIEGDDGSYAYSKEKSGAVHARICYYNLYQYNNGTEPMYLMGTNSMGQDLFCAIGIGARFSLIFAVLVSSINMFLGAVYGAIQGYYGGWVDMLLDRIVDILSGVPFIVVTTLFQLHLAQKVGVLPSFLFAFVLTGWIGMAALVRKQFYRFKSLEFVMAARTLGAGDFRLMFKHIFPNALGTIVTSCALIIPSAISSETSMTYLGIVDLTTYAGATIGTLLSTGQASMTTAPHGMFWPSLFFALLMISFNLFGNGLRDAFNPSTRGADD